MHTDRPGKKGMQFESRVSMPVAGLSLVASVSFRADPWPLDFTSFRAAWISDETSGARLPPSRMRGGEVFPNRPSGLRCAIGPCDRKSRTKLLSAGRLAGIGTQSPVPAQPARCRSSCRPRVRYRVVGSTPRPGPGSAAADRTGACGCVRRTHRRV